MPALSPNRPHLPVVAEPLQLAVTPDRGAGAVLDQALGEVGVPLEDVSPLSNRFHAGPPAEAIGPRISARTAPMSPSRDR